MSYFAETKEKKTQIKSNSHIPSLYHTWINLYSQTCGVLHPDQQGSLAGRTRPENPLHPEEEERGKRRRRNCCWTVHRSLVHFSRYLDNPLSRAPIRSRGILSGGPSPVVLPVEMSVVPPSRSATGWPRGGAVQFGNKYITGPAKPLTLERTINLWVHVLCLLRLMQLISSNIRHEIRDVWPDQWDNRCHREEKLITSSITMHQCLCLRLLMF